MTCSTINEIRDDTKALKQLADLEEIVDLPPSLGGFHFLRDERDFIVIARQLFDDRLGFTLMQRERIDRIWRAVQASKA